MAYVCHHVHYTWHHIHPLRRQQLILMTLHGLYWWHHMHYIWHVIYCLWYHIHFMRDITQCLYLWHGTLYVYDISTLYGITHSVMTTQPLCNFTLSMSDITPTESVSSHTVDQFYQTQCIYDITATMCMTSYALQWHHIHNLAHHNTLCMTSVPLYLPSLPLHLCHHTHPIDDITATIYLTSHPAYLWHHIHYIYDIISTRYDITILCVDDTTLGICMTSFALRLTTHPLHHTKPHYIQFINDITHNIYDTCDNTKVISAISPFISDTTSTVSVSSKPVYQFYYTNSFMTLHTIRMLSHSVCMTSHEHFMTSHPYNYDITSSIFMTSYPIYMLSPILFHENKTTIPGISPTVLDITATAPVWSHPLYQWLYNNYGSLHTSLTYDIIHSLHHIKFRLYDINRQYLGHHKHCIHDIRSPIYDITSTVYDISSPKPLMSQPLYR